MSLKRDLNLFARIDEPGLTGIDVYKRAYAGYTLFGINTGLRGETLAGVVNQ